MAAPSFALIQSGSLTGAANITFVTGEVRRRQFRKNTTNSGSGTTSQTTLGRFEHMLQASGFWDTGGNTYPLPVGVNTANGPIKRFSRVRLRKKQVTKNVTAGPDGEDDNVRVKGVVTYVGSAMGYMQADEAILSSDTTQTIAQASISNFFVPLDTARNITASEAKIYNIREQMRFAEGGAVLVRFQFVMSGTITLNGSNHPFNATEFSATLKADNGDQWGGTVIYDQIDADIDYDNGSPTRIGVKGAFSGAPAVTITAV